MTDPLTLRDLPTPMSADHALLQRVRHATKSDRTLSAAIHDGAAALSIPIQWHEADVLAEAIRHHYDETMWVHQIVHRRLFEEAIEHLRRALLRDLLRAVHEADAALVEKPVETIHVVSHLTGMVTPQSRVPQTSPALTLAEARALCAKHPDTYPVVMLTGKVRKLAEAT